MSAPIACLKTCTVHFSSRRLNSEEGAGVELWRGWRGLSLFLSSIYAPLLIHFAPLPNRLAGFCFLGDDHYPYSILCWYCRWNAYSDLIHSAILRVVDKGMVSILSFALHILVFWCRVGLARVLFHQVMEPPMKDWKCLYNSWNTLCYVMFVIVNNSSVWN